MRRTIAELLHLGVGLAGAALVASLAAWSVPVARTTIWQVAYAAMSIVAVMAIRPVRLAWRADRALVGQHDDLPPGGSVG